ncbi:hypothetical protein [Novosphingobium terrae]|uniref:hypothetical protein n=1 Tax=Novosphingobium terrae TaxID=2726189 RepID=UPI00197FD96B|nr:hypothetical protein [Novosphingobium terrae]
MNQPLRLGLQAAIMLALPVAAHAQSDPLTDLTQCRAVAEDKARLSCFDKAAAHITPPRWAGRLSFSTEPFEIDRPTLIRFESEGVIFVMALKDAQGEIVQNLHHAGKGEGRYLIAHPGTYSLQINGAEGWRIWLEPQP